MQIAVTVAGFSPGEADTLRRAMGSRRSPAKMAAMRSRFLTGAAELHGLVGQVADRLWDRIVAFASYGFPESHAQSFASLVYFSAWFKYHHPAEFCVALLRAQPMGFYSPQSLIADARRHGVPVLPVDVNASGVEASVEKMDAGEAGAACSAGETGASDGLHGSGTAWGIRPGLSSVRGIGDDVAEDLVAARRRLSGGFRTVADLSREAGVTVDQVTALARAGACDCLGLTRRQAVWAAGQAATERPGMLPGTSVFSTPALPGMSVFELAAADIATTGVTTDGHPVRLLRQRLDAWPGSFPVVPASELLTVEDGRRILVAGVVTHRQRPATAGGVTFLGMEDETGLINVMVSPGLWRACRTVASGARMLMVRGIVENAGGAATVRADRLEQLVVDGAGAESDSVAGTGVDAQTLAGRSRDFR